MQMQTRDGVAIRLHAGETVSTSVAALRAQEQMFDLLVRRLPVSVTIVGLERPRYAGNLFSQVCGLIDSAISEAQAKDASISIAVDADVLSPRQLWVRRCEILGTGPLYLLVGSQLTRPSTVQAERLRQDRFWAQCWQLRGHTLIRFALAPVVSSPCPLFAPERAGGILPPVGLQVPPGTAWATMRIDLMDYCNGRGEICNFALRECVIRNVEYGERVHNETDWPTAAMRDDSWSNRRLAINVAGVGDLAVAGGIDPGNFKALQSLGKVLQLVRDTANEHSRHLAAQSEHAPALCIAEPEQHTQSIVELAGWQSRWQAALKFAATRHRNLLAMSPWAVFPSVGPADSRFFDLLPLLAYADVCAFPAPPSLQPWNLNKFKHFHRRLWAVLEQKDEQQMFAERV